MKIKVYLGLLNFYIYYSSPQATRKRIAKQISSSIHVKYFRC